MALVTQAAGICVIAALLGLVLRRSSPEVTLLLALAAAAAVLLALGLGCVVYLLYHFWGGGQE